MSSRDSIQWLAEQLTAELAEKPIDAVPQSHPFEIRYADVEKIDWESCRKILDRLEKKRILEKCW